MGSNLVHSFVLTLKLGIIMSQHGHSTYYYVPGTVMSTCLMFVNPDSCVQFHFIMFGANYVPVEGLFHVRPKKLEHA